MISLTCGVSLQKAARIIAIVDIVYCFLSVIIRTAIAVVQAAYTVQIQQDVHHESLYPVSRLNPAAFKPASENGTKGSVSISLPNGEANLHNTDPNETDEFAVDIGNLFTFLLILMAGTVAYIVFELWMCRLLLGASKNLDKESCKRWWWYRLTMSAILLFICIVLTLVINRGWFSWVLELVIFYRIYELVIIHQFKNDIGATSSRVQIRNSPQ